MFMSNSVKSKAGNPTLEVSILYSREISRAGSVSSAKVESVLPTRCTVIRLCPNKGPFHLTLILGNLNRFGGFFMFIP